MVPFEGPLDTELSLNDKYQLKRGSAVMNGMQALVRLMMEQMEMDREQGLQTRSLVSGYRGSPVGALDQAFWQAGSAVDDAGIVFQEGLNEDLAMTAMGGTQLVPLLDDSGLDGVVGMWYGKGPGVDRSVDAIRHASHQGTSPHGGIVMIAGDDASGKSSTLAHQSDQTLMAGMVPVLFPASIHELVPLGLHAIALSRYAGVPAAIKLVADVADSAGTLDLDRLRPDFAPLEPAESKNGLHAKPGFQPFLEVERCLNEERIPAVLAYAKANRLNHPIWEPKTKRLGIVVVGRAYPDLMEALEELALEQDAGIGIFKVAMTWPLEPSSLAAFARGYDELLVLEDKKDFVETQAAKVLLGLTDDERPRLVGKFNPDGKRIMPSFGELSAHLIVDALLDRLGALDMAPAGKTAAAVHAHPVRALNDSQPAQRVPWYCSGCPHNTSTKVPEGSTAISGIGCHTISAIISPETHEWCAQMGGEGGTWLGRAPFSDKKHTFQNMGDGTYQHSGFLAIRACIMAGVNITFKILYNDAVAMTGGQPLESHSKPWSMAAQILAEGAAKVVVVADPAEMDAVAGRLPAGVPLYERKDLDEVQRELREIQGTTAIIYVQTCAAEKRRRRKRGKFPNPNKRVMIASRVCEGCGDCGIKSNCVAIKPKDSIFGTKREIDQTACNKDFSCLKGFCPSFLTIEHDKEPLLGSRSNLISPPDMGLLGEPERPSDARLLVTGVGGTGVVTVGAVLTMAARLQGQHALTLDQAGLAQKNGAVASQIQLSQEKLDGRPARLPDGSVDTLIACDLVTGASDASLTALRTDAQIVANAHVEPLAAFAVNPSARPQTQSLLERLSRIVPKENIRCEDVVAMAHALLADGMGVNFMVVGMAYQAGRLPMSAAAIERALELNGVSVAMNVAAFRWGRWLYADRDKAHEAAGWHDEAHRPEELSLDALKQRFGEELEGYQSSSYAQRFTRQVERLQANPALSQVQVMQAARALYKVMAYKDEYEVARLLSHPDTKAEISDQFKQGAKISLNLAPPLLSSVDPQTGEPRKTQFGPWILPLLAMLKHGKALRGSAFDPFGHSDERRMERHLIQVTEALLAKAADSQDEKVLSELLVGFGLILEIKGFGPVKQRAYDKVKHRLEALAAQEG